MTRWMELTTPIALDFSNTDMDATIAYYFHMDAEELAIPLNERIQERTAMRTGALRADETYEVNLDFLDPVILTFYTSGINEDAEWGRTYARFIEGPSLGFSSPTINAPSHMYQSVETEDTGIIEAWAEQELTKIADLWTNGGGVK
jgi:hypothetical protein